MIHSVKCPSPSDMAKAMFVLRLFVFNFFFILFHAYETGEKVPEVSNL